MKVTLNIRHTITDEIKLSSSIIEDGEYESYAVALLRNGKVVNDTAAEFRAHKDNVERMWQADNAAFAHKLKLVESVLGEVPLRFFRDNVIE